MTTARYAPRAIRLCRNINEAFRAIVEIARKLKIDLSQEVASVVNGILTIGGMVIGGLTAGPRGVVSGGMAGASLANSVMKNNNLVSLTDYLLNYLPGNLKSYLVDLFSRLLSPFYSVEEAVRTISNSDSRIGKFKNLMEMFLNQYDNSYHVSG